MQTVQQMFPAPKLPPAFDAERQELADLADGWREGIYADRATVLECIAEIDAARPDLRRQVDEVLAAVMSPG